MPLRSTVNKTTDSKKQQLLSSSMVVRTKPKSQGTKAKKDEPVIVVSDSDDAKQDDVVPLDSDDAMYKGNALRNRVNSSTPLKTRSSARKSVKRKKGEDSDVDEDQTKTTKPSEMQPVAKKAKKSKAAAQDDGDEPSNKSEPFAKDKKRVTTVTSMKDNIDVVMSSVEDDPPPSQDANKSSIAKKSNAAGKVANKSSTAKKANAAGKVSEPADDPVSEGHGEEEPRNLPGKKVKTAGRKSNSKGTNKLNMAVKEGIEVQDQDLVHSDGAQSLPKTPVRKVKNITDKKVSAVKHVDSGDGSAHEGDQPVQGRGKGNAPRKDEKNKGDANNKEKQINKRSLEKKSTKAQQVESNAHEDADKGTPYISNKIAQNKSADKRDVKKIPVDEDTTEHETEDEEDSEVPAPTRHGKGARIPNVIKRKGNKVNVIDDEAEETEKDESDSDSGDDMEEDMNNYDLDDPFIDDSGAMSPTEENNEFVAILKKTAVKGTVNTDKGKAKASVEAAPSPDWDTSHYTDDPAVNEESHAADSDGEVEDALVRQAIQESRSAPAPAHAESSKKAPVSKIPTDKAGRRTFRDLDAIARPSVKGSNVTQAPSVNVYRVTSLPQKCEVFNPQLQDPYLTEFYVGLPNLKQCVFVSWSELPGPGPYWFSSWADQCPDMDVDLCIAVMNFETFGQFIGPARASPMITRAVKVSKEGDRSNLLLDGKPAILISTMFSDRSQLLTLPEKGSGARSKSISGRGHFQEWERQVSFLGMAFGHDELHAQIFRDSLMYATKSVSRNAESDMGPANRQSPSTRTSQAKSSLPTTEDKMSLQGFERVPIYDATTTSFDANKDWPNLHKILPPFRREVPRGSFVAVAYTCNTYLSSNNKWSISNNVQFVVVLGTPSA